MPLIIRKQPRIHLLRSSFTRLASIFSVFIFIAIGLVGYEIYLFRIGEMPAKWLMQFSLGLLLFIVIGLFIVSFFITKRINQIVETAERIMRTGDISQRIPVYQSRDDLSTLSHTLNLMLSEIERLVQGVRTVSDNIAHDLRHPLTHLRNRLEEFRSSMSHTDKQLQAQEMQELIQECDALLSTFNALLRISNIESAKRHTGFANVALDKIINDIIELYEPLASDKSVSLQLTATPAIISGDKDLLFQAIANLVDNAIKYTCENTTVTIRLLKDKKSARLIIEDQGPGIATEHRANVFNRFYRIESCRSTPGNGLGLSLVRAIVALHGGTIALGNAETRGLRVSIMFD